MPDCDIIAMQALDHTYRNIYSELAQRTLDDAFSTEFSPAGRFIRMESRGRRYWYFDTAKEDGGKRRQYVGPVDDAELTARVESFKRIKSDLRARRKLVSTLVREAGLPAPDPYVGDIVAAFAEAGFFRLRGVLVGTIAYQCYPAIIGARLPNTAMQTDDADFAQFHSISAAVDDGLPLILDLLRRVDATFREIPHQGDPRHASRFVSKSGYKVEFLTPNTGSADYEGRPATMPALGGASAEPLRFLDFLIHRPIRAVMLHGSGIPALVPAPERYAVHKLIVGSRRRAENDPTAKSWKDRQQALQLMRALLQQRRGADLADAYMEAWDRGPSWRRALSASMRALAPDIADVERLLREEITRLGGTPIGYGLEAP